MRATPHHLTTIISYTSKTHESDGKASKSPRGLLVSSFNTITLSPTPYVSFNIKLPSSTFDAIGESGSFTASGLSKASVAHAFTKGRGAKSYRHFVGDGGKLSRACRGGTWWMQCEWIKGKSVEVEDHVIMIGKVIDAGHYNKQGRMGVVYAEQQYRRVGIAVNPDNKNL